MNLRTCDYKHAFMNSCAIGGVEDQKIFGFLLGRVKIVICIILSSL